METRSFNKVINYIKLMNEIISAGLPYEGMTLLGDAFEISFSQPLTEEQDSQLSGLVDSHETFDIVSFVADKITAYQLLAPSILAQIYTENKLAGITAEESDQVFENFSDIIIRINQGAFPTALYRLATKQPSGFATQERINSWITKLTLAMS